MSTVKKQITGLRQKQTLLYIMLLSLATVIIWVVISLISSQNKPGISPELQKLAVPLTPTLNQDTLSRIERKQFYNESEFTSFPIYKIITSPNGSEERVVTIDTEVDTVFPSANRVNASPSPSPVPTIPIQATESAAVPVSSSSSVVN